MKQGIAVDNKRYGKLFISHSSQDEDVGLVRKLRVQLELLDQPCWIDSSELCAGDSIEKEIQDAIASATAFLVVISPRAFQSEWVAKELEIACKIQKQRGKDEYPIIPLTLDKTELGSFKNFFGDEPLCVSVSTNDGCIDNAVNSILTALGKRLPVDPDNTLPPKPAPLEDLVLELSDLKFKQLKNNIRRASAKARLVYEPATAGQPKVFSQKYWRFTAPLGPIEEDEMRWYLEKYAIWPSENFQKRASQIEEKLIEWGKLLYQTALPPKHTANVLQAWAKIGDRADRRFSVYLDTLPEAGIADSKVKAAQVAATKLLGLPWELLHDKRSFLFQGGKPCRVRRRLPNTESYDAPLLATPIRILLISPRPEDEACGYIDHRAGALPLIAAMETLGGLVDVQLLNPSTLPALRVELENARQGSRPYHVVHFDGHGVYDSSVGLGGLCFENPRDKDKFERRLHYPVYTDELGPLLYDYRIPLVFLQACQTAQVGEASKSMALEMLRNGVASVVAMSHSVSEETTRLFVESFYHALTEGKRVGAAMLAGQQALKDDSFRGRIFGAGELRLQDWFVPVLFQEEDDPQLFPAALGRQARADIQTALQASLGALPSEPAGGFIGRGRELLALQRLLNEQRYAVLRGQGGEGKTTLAVELARWLVRSRQIQRAAFVTMETHRTVRAVLDSIGKQLKIQSSETEFTEIEQAILPIERALSEQATLVVLDSMESLLPPPYSQTHENYVAPYALDKQNIKEPQAILKLCTRINRQGETRLLFTSRETLPAPFNGFHNLWELYRLNRDDAVELIERSLYGTSVAGRADQVERPDIEALVDAVHCHAHTLALLAPYQRNIGVARTLAELVELMVDMEQKFPGQREHSLYASVEMSFRRLSPNHRHMARVLGFFHGVVDLEMLTAMMDWKKTAVEALAEELIATGLATADTYRHLSLNPALCSYLHIRLADEEREALTKLWIAKMSDYVEFIYAEQTRNTKIATTLTLLELPNLSAMLEWVQCTAEAETVIYLADKLYCLLRNLGKPSLLARVVEVSNAALTKLGASWNHASFVAKYNQTQQQLEKGNLPDALIAAQGLLSHVLEKGENAYANADCDLASTYLLLARVLSTNGNAEQSLTMLEVAKQRFTTIAKEHPSRDAERMEAVCINDCAQCLLELGRLDEAAVGFQEAISRAEQRVDQRDAAVGKGQLGTVRLQQRRYQEALQLYAGARDYFRQLNEPGIVAAYWHQIGIAYQNAEETETAEDAYKQSLVIMVQLGDLAGQAKTLGQLGNLYNDSLSRPEEAVGFYRQAVEKYIAIKDIAGEGRQRNNLGETFRKLSRFDDARQEIRRAMDCKAWFGYSATPWTAWAVLAAIETDAGDPNAAKEARRVAQACYLAYRRDGGENHDTAGRLANAITSALLAGDRDAAGSQLRQRADNPDWAELLPYIHALQAIVVGSRDRSLTDAEDLRYGEAAEILLLIEKLEEQVDRTDSFLK